MSHRHLLPTSHLYHNNSNALDGINEIGVSPNCLIETQLLEKYILLLTLYPITRIIKIFYLHYHTTYYGTTLMLCR